MATKSSHNDNFEHTNEAKRSALEECLAHLKKAQELIERSLNEDKPKPN